MYKEKVKSKFVSELIHLRFVSECACNRAGAFSNISQLSVIRTKSNHVLKDLQY